MSKDDYKGKWFVELMKAPIIVWHKESDEPKTIIHNHYYIYNDNRVVKVTEEEFKKFVKDKKLIDNKTRLIEHEI